MEEQKMKDGARKQPLPSASIMILTMQVELIDFPTHLLIQIIRLGDMYVLHSA